MILTNHCKFDFKMIDDARMSSISARKCFNAACAAIQEPDYSQQLSLSNCARVSFHGMRIIHKSKFILDLLLRHHPCHDALDNTFLLRIVARLLSQSTAVDTLFDVCGVKSQSHSLENANGIGEVISLEL
ncbi:unnamed protein product [Albugo candida]|uniref:Uncharacterized protein n=1 Tax=Albugo candida TaxID=65357 RepID=A0A024GV68_9STRA|nr:unnamed protein product [Albugo candida]|eukprot:CCI50274.1 unnamed protein product [Albugo candida]